MPRGVFAIAFPFGIVASGCLAEETTTRIVVRDVGQVSLRAPGGVLEPGASEAKLAEGTIVPEAKALTRYELHAARAPGGSLAFEWSLSAPLLNGEHQTLVDPGGVVELDHAAGVSRDTLAEPALRVTTCAGLLRTTTKGTFVGYRAVEWQPCIAKSGEPAASVPYTLDTQWSNVRELRQTVRPNTSLAVGSMITATVLFGGLGALVLGLASPRNAWGWSLIGVGVALDLAWLPTLVARERDTVVYDPASAGPRLP